MVSKIPAKRVSALLRPPSAEARCDTTLLMEFMHRVKLPSQAASGDADVDDMGKVAASLRSHRLPLSCLLIAADVFS